MNEETKQNLMVASVVVSAVALVGLAGLQVRNVFNPAPQTQPQVVQQPQIVVPPPNVYVDVKESPISVDPKSDRLLGGLIHNIQESFDEGIAVDGTEVISGTGKISVLAGLDITGNVTTTGLLTSSAEDFTSVTTTQTLCSIRNTTGADRVLAGAFPTLEFSTSSNTGGTYHLTISQSASAGATGTGSDLYYENQLSAPTDGVANLTATSTVSDTGDIWYAGNYINFLIGSPTTTLTGTCRVPSS